MKKRSKKFILIGCIVALLLAITIYFLRFTFPGLELCDYLFDPFPGKQEIITTLLQNKATFDDSIKIINNLDKYISHIGLSDIDGNESMPKNMQNYSGLYTGGLNGEYVIRPFKNNLIEQLFLNFRVRDITIHGNDYYPFDVDKSIEFGCGGSGFGKDTFYTGIVWTNDGKPTGFQGEVTSLKKDGKGWSWKETKGDNRYYTEKISGHYYYYEMWF